MQLESINRIEFSGDFADVPDGRGSPNEMGPGSRNVLCLAQSHKRAWKGVEFVGRGARVMMQVKATHGGLADYAAGESSSTGSITAATNVLTDGSNPFLIGDDGAVIQLLNSSSNGIDQIGFLKYVSASQVTLWLDEAFTIPMNAGTTFAGNLSYIFGSRIEGAGSLFSHVASTLFYQGAGQVVYNGEKITGALASSTLKLLLQRNGSYEEADSGPYSAGLVQPSAPQVFVKTTPSPGFAGLLNSPALSLKIACIRSTTGAKSIASPTSEVFACANQTVAVVVPIMQTGGTHWVFFAARKGFGGIGPHERLPIRQFEALQVPETYFTRTVTDAVTNSTTTLTSATAVFSSLDVGKQIVLSGGGSLTTTIATFVSPTQVTLTALAGWSSSGNTAVINAMVANTNPRTITDGVTNGTTLLTSATAAWTQADVGKQLYLSGGTGSLSQVRTIATVTNATDVVMSATVAASTGISVAIADVTGTIRAIELEWQDGDLTGEFAWIDDYPPPAGTHCAGLNNVGLVGGCFSDATADPTSSGPGTCIAVSLQNFPESFRPTDLLYLPEPIMAFSGRPSDSYLDVFCRDSVHQVQYVGGTDGPACVLTTLWPDVGIANPHGACRAYGVLFAAVSRGGLVTIGPLGQPDNTFAAPIAEAIKDWDPRLTILNWHPDTNQVVASNGNEAYAFSLAHGGWSSVLPYSDFAPGNALSAVQSTNQMKVTLDGEGAHTLYEFNSGGTSTITALSHWFTDPGEGRTKTIWEVAEKVQMDSLSKLAYVSIHRNFRVPSNKTGAITIATNTLSTTSDFFTAADIGSFVLILGAGPGGGCLLARIKTVPNAQSANLCDPVGPLASAANLNASATVSNAFFLIAKRIYARSPRYADSNLFRPKRVRVREAFSYAIGITIPSTSQNVQALGASLFGTIDRMSAGANS